MQLPERVQPVAGEPSSEELLASYKPHQLAGFRPAENISSREKWLSIAGGAAALATGLLRGKASGLLLAGVGGALLYRGWSRHCHLYDALGINTAEHSSATSVPAQQGYRVERAVTIARPASELYAWWRKIENLPLVFPHLKSVEPLADKRSRWTAEGPLGVTLQWEAETINQRDNELIAWRSLEGSRVETAGSVRFETLPHDRGTVVRVNCKYNPPGGKVGAVLAGILGSGFQGQVAAGLARFKSEIEAGEIPTTDGQPRGRHSSKHSQFHRSEDSYEGPLLAR